MSKAERGQRGGTDVCPTGYRRLLVLGAVIFTIAIIGGGVVAAAGTAGSSSDTFAATAIDSTSGGEAKWGEALGEGTDATEATVVDGVVYIGTDEGEVLALDAETGDELWDETMVDVTDRSSTGITTAPSVVDGVVYVGATDADLDGHLFAYDAETGDELWSESISTNSVRSSPVVYDDSVYVGTDDGFLRAHDVEDGSQDWVEEVSFEWLRGESPVAADGTLYVPIDGGDLVALEADTGEELWDQTLDTRVRSTPAYVDGTVYITSRSLESNGCTVCYPRELPSYTYTIHALDATDGTEEWTFGDDDETLTRGSSPTVVGGSTGTVYFTSSFDTAYAVDASDGTLEQEYEVDEGLLTGTPTVADETVFLTTTRGFNDAAGVYAFDADTGDEEWFLGDESALASPIVSDGSVFVPTRAGVSDLTTYRAIDTGVGVSSQDAQAVQGTNGHTDAWTGTEPDEPIVVVEAELHEDAIVEDFGDDDPDTLSVDVTLRNVGSQTVTHEATLEVDGEEPDDQATSLEIPAYGEREVTLESAVEEPGEYDVSVDGEFVDSLLVLPQVDPVYMEDAAFESEPVLADEEIVVEATFENLGGSGGAYDVSMLVDGVEHDAKTFDIDGNGVASVTFETTINEAGTYDVTIDGEDGSVGVDNRSVGTLDVRDEPTFITDGELTQNRILVDESLPFDATVRNIGDEEDTHQTTVEFIPVVGDDVGPTTVGTSTVPANGELEDSLAVPPNEVDEVGVHTVKLSEETAEGDEELLDIGTVQVLGDPLQFRDARLVNESVDPGESIELELVYENVKSEAVSQEVTVDRDGKEVLETVELEAYETDTVRIELDGFDDPGVYDLTVSDEKTDVDGHTETVFVGESDYFVPENGTIQEAVDAASPGDVIAVAGGTYAESVEIDTEGLEIVGFDGERPVLDGEDGANATAFTIDAADVTIDGVEIEDYANSGLDIRFHEGTTVANATIRGNGEYGIVGGIPGNDPDGVTIEHTVIEAHSEGAMDIGSPDDAMVHANSLIDNGDGIDVGFDATVTNNTIDGQTGSVAIRTWNRATIAHNFITDAEYSGIYVRDASTVEHNVVIAGDTGIRLNGDDIDVHDNDISSGLDDLRISGTTGHTITDNTFETGVLLTDASEQSGTSLTFADNDVGGDPLVAITDQTAPSIPTDAGQVILIDVDDATLEGQAFDGVISPVQVVNGTDVEIRDLQITDGPSANIFGSGVVDRGAVSIWDSPGVVVETSTFSTMGDHAIRLSHSPNASVSDNAITDTNRQAIAIEWSADTTVTDNEIDTASSGIFVQRSDRTAVERNSLETLDGSAIEFQDSEDVAVTDNTVVDANRALDDIFEDFAIGGGDTGVGNDGAITGTEIRNNSVQESGAHGILVAGSENLSITDNEITDGVHGIAGEWGSDMTGDGVHVSSNTVANNTEQGLAFGIGTGDLAGLSITDNEIRDNDEIGLLIDSTAVDVTVSDNDITGNADGASYEAQSGQLDLTANWWGDASGPSGGLEDPQTGAIADGDGDSIAPYILSGDPVENVHFDPWAGKLGAFTADCNGLECTFESDTSDDLEIVHYEWDFGDGTTETTDEETVTHTYDDEGTYTVELTVETEDGATGSFEREVGVAADADECGVVVAEGESIQDAIDAADAGDTVCLEFGTFNEEVVIDNSLTLTAAGPAPTLDGEGTLDTAITVEETAGVHVEGLEIVNYNDGVHVDGATDVTVDGLEIEPSTRGVFADAGSAVTVTDVESTGGTNGVATTFDFGELTVRDSTFTDAHRGVYVDNWNVTLENNTMVGNDYGVYLVDHGVDHDDSSGSITDNVFEDHVEAGLWVEDYGSLNQSILDEVEFTDNAMANNTVGVDAELGDGYSLDARENWWGDDSGPSGGVEDPIEGTLADGQGDPVSEQVRFDPFLGEPPAEPVEEPGTIAGTVTAVDDGAPIDGADVAVLDGSDVVAETTTDGDGTFDLAVDPGTYDLTVDADEYEESTVSNLIVNEDEETTQNVDLEAVDTTGTLTGEVTNASDGQPLAATVVLVDVNGLLGPTGEEYPMMTDETTGVYEHPLLEPGTYDLRFEAPGYENTTVDDVAVDTGEQTLDAALEPMEAEDDSDEEEEDEDDSDEEEEDEDDSDEEEEDEDDSDEEEEDEDDSDEEEEDEDDEEDSSSPAPDPDPAAFSIESVAIPTSVNETDSVTATVTIENVGEESGTETVQLLIDETVYENASIDLEGGETTQLSYEIEADELEVGSHEIQITVDESLESIVLEVAAVADEGDEDDEEDDGDDEAADPDDTDEEDPAGDETETDTEDDDDDVGVDDDDEDDDEDLQTDDGDDVGDEQVPDDDTTADDSTPGFGQLAALIVLLGVAVAVIRRP